MATNHTTNYDLNLWQPTDKFSREEINENTQKLDAAVKAVDTKANAKADASALNSLAQTVNAKADAAALAALTQAVAGKGNCSVVFGSYIGTGECGTDHPTVLTFDRPPQMVFVVAETGANMWMIRGQKKTLGYTPGYALHNTLTWSGNTVSFYGPDAAEQLTSSGKTFYYAALFLE